MSHVIHELKTISPYYEQVWRGEKTAELRRNDRNFARGDELLLREFVPPDHYTGSDILAEVTNVFEGGPGLSAGYCMLSLRIRERWGRQGGDAG